MGGLRVREIEQKRMNVRVNTTKSHLLHFITLTMSAASFPSCPGLGDGSGNGGRAWVLNSQKRAFFSAKKKEDGDNYIE